MAALNRRKSARIIAALKNHLYGDGFCWTSAAIGAIRLFERTATMAIDEDIAAIEALPNTALKQCRDHA